MYYRDRTSNNDLVSALILRNVPIGMLMFLELVEQWNPSIWITIRNISTVRQVYYRDRYSDVDLVRLYQP